MEKILLSIIVPVYNVEKYLNECLDSIFGSTADENEYEVIAVDDGSKDRSPEILKTYGHHNNFRIITQENAGLGPARNTGINAANGKYIYFVDSDDYLSPSAVQTLLSFVRTSDCDIIEFEFELKYEVSKPTWKYEPQTQRTPASGKGKVLFAEWHKQFFFTTTVWNRVYKRDFINMYSLRFLPIIYEDIPWQVECFFYAEKIIYHPVTIYYYRVREGSIMLSHISSKKWWAHIKCIDEINKFRKTIEPNEENSDFLTELGSELACRLESEVNNMYKHTPKKEIKTMFNEIKRLREILGLSTDKKGRRMYKLTRYLPAKLAFRMYKIF